MYKAITEDDRRQDNPKDEIPRDTQAGPERTNEPSKKQRRALVFNAYAGRDWYQL